MARIGVLGGIAAFALLFGLLFRLHPYAMGAERITQFFITEDGYLMLTLARNLAIGLGLSVAEGTIASNGVQPLATLIYAVAFWLVDGDKLGGVAIVLGLMVVIWVMAALVVRRFADAVLADGAEGRGSGRAFWPGRWRRCGRWGAVGASQHERLETGLYVLCVVPVRAGLWPDRGAGAAAGDGRDADAGRDGGLAFWAPMMRCS